MKKKDKDNGGTADEKRLSALKERARRIASARAEVAPVTTLTVTQFILAGERYAVESSHIREIRPLEHITPLPGTPAFVAGIINVRSEIISVIDIKKFFDLPQKGLTNLSKVIILSSPDMEFGILADEVLGTRTLNLDNLEPALATLTGIREEYLKGVTADRTAVLDAVKLLSDKRIVVREGVET